MRLTEQLLGWRLPVSGLADWIEGRPVPQRFARIERDGERIVLFEQDGWVIRLSEYLRRFCSPAPSGARAPVGRKHAVGSLASDCR